MKSTGDSAVISYLKELSSTIDAVSLIDFKVILILQDLESVVLEEMAESMNGISSTGYLRERYPFVSEYTLQLSDVTMRAF